MILARKGNFHFWQFKIFSGFAGLHHFLTDKQSLGKNFSDYNNFRNSNSHIHENLDRVAELLGIAGSSIYLSHQTHSSNILNVEKGMNNIWIQDVDAFISDCRQVCLVVKTADCVSILLYDTAKRAIAAVHAGWRGTVKKILSETIQSMQYHFHSNPKDLIAAIGPSICSKCYEVGKDVTGQVKETFPYWDSLIRYDGHKAYFNLKEANKRQLLLAGVKEENIEISEECTFERTDLFYSARKESASTGRMLTGIWIE